MRSVGLVTTLVLVGAFGLQGCKDRAKEAEEQAMKEAAAEERRKAAAKGSDTAAAEVVKPPVEGKRQIPCEQLWSSPDFTTALGETTPLELRDQSAKYVETTATCAFARGGVAPSEAEQKAIIKKNGRLGVLAGDELCRVSLYCWTPESEERLRKKCNDSGKASDESTGGFACITIIPTGSDDVKSFRMFDADTGCVVDVGAGPSMVDNDFIAKCAKTVRDALVPEKLAAKAGAAPTP